MSTPTRNRSKRLEVRATEAERDLIDRAAAASDMDLTTFVLTNLRDAAHRTLADRDHFALSAEQASEWDRINRRPSRELAGLRRLAERPSPFAE